MKCAVTDDKRTFEIAVFPDYQEICTYSVTGIARSAALIESSGMISSREARNRVRSFHLYDLLLADYPRVMEYWKRTAPNSVLDRWLGTHLTLKPSKENAVKFVATHVLDLASNLKDSMAGIDGELIWPSDWSRPVALPSRADVKVTLPVAPRYTFEGDALALSFWKPGYIKEAVRKEGPNKGVKVRCEEPTNAAAGLRHRACLSARAGKGDETHQDTQLGPYPLSKAFNEAFLKTAPLSGRELVLASWQLACSPFFLRPELTLLCNMIVTDPAGKPDDTCAGSSTLVKAHWELLQANARAYGLGHKEIYEGYLEGCRGPLKKIRSDSGSALR